jgi:hypothetical protein
MAVLVGILAECVFLAAVLPPVALLPALAVWIAPGIDPTITPQLAGLAAFILGCMLALPVKLIRHKD